MLEFGKPAGNLNRSQIQRRKYAVLNTNYKSSFPSPSLSKSEIKWLWIVLITPPRVRLFISSQDEGVLRRRRRWLCSFGSNDSTNTSPIIRNKVDKGARETTFAYSISMNVEIWLRGGRLFRERLLSADNPLSPLAGLWNCYLARSRRAELPPPPPWGSLFYIQLAY